jgi:hypothetical protein
VSTAWRPPEFSGIGGELESHSEKEAMKLAGGREQRAGCPPGRATTQQAARKRMQELDAIRSRIEDAFLVFEENMGGGFMNDMSELSDPMSMAKAAISSLAVEMTRKSVTRTEALVQTQASMMELNQSSSDIPDNYEIEGRESVITEANPNILNQAIRDSGARKDRLRQV